MALQQLHHNEGLPFPFFNRMDGADVGVVERRGGACFALKSLHRGRIVGQFLGQELQRDAATQLDVFRLVHHTHAAAAQNL